jgi:hypothetical protein
MTPALTEAFSGRYFALQMVEQKCTVFPSMVRFTEVVVETYVPHTGLRLSSPTMRGSPAEDCLGVPVSRNPETDLPSGPMIEQRQ